MEEDSSSPKSFWSKVPAFYKGLAIFAVVGVPIGLLLQSNQTNQAQANAAAQQPRQGGAAQPRQGTSLGGVAPSAEFNQTYAERLRQQVEAEAAARDARMRREFDSKLEQAQEKARVENEAQITRVLEAINAQQRPTAQPTPTQAPIEPKAVRPPRASQTIGEAQPTQPGQGGAGQAESAAMSASDNQAIVPPQGFIRARMLNGLIVQADQPKTFLARLEGEYVAANGYRVTLNGCLATVEATADIAAGRVEGKPVRMTCNYSGGRSQTWDLAGYIADQDGIRGVRGIIADNLANKVRALAVAEGIAATGSALAQAQQSTTSNGVSTTTALTGSVGRAALGGAISGAGRATTQAVQEYYDQYKTTIQVGSGTLMSIVLLNELAVAKDGTYISPVRSAEAPLLRPANQQQAPQ